MKKRTKRIIIVCTSVFGVLAVLSICIFVKLFALLGRGSKTVDSLEEYIVLCETEEYYPKVPVENFIDCDRLYFHYEQLLSVLSSERWYCMVRTYDNLSYAKQKALFYKTYSFATEATEQQTGGYSPDFCFGGFAFHIDSLSSYPKSMLFIGFNEAENKICYLYFEDYELDLTDDFPFFFQQHGFIPE